MDKNKTKVRKHIDKIVKNICIEQQKLWIFLSFISNKFRVLKLNIERIFFNISEIPFGAIRRVAYNVLNYSVHCKIKIVNSSTFSVQINSKSIIIIL